MFCGRQFVWATLPVFYIMCVFSHGTHVTNHCVRARLGIRVKGSMVVINNALVEKA